MEIKDHWKKNALVDEKEYLSMYKDSVENNENFWNQQGDRINWKKKYSKTKKFVVVDVKAKKRLRYAVGLDLIKSQKKLSHLSLIKQSRLSVMPIDKKSWDIINKMAT